MRRGPVLGDVCWTAMTAVAPTVFGLLALRGLGRGGAVRAAAQALAGPLLAANLGICLSLILQRRKIPRVATIPLAVPPALAPWSTLTVIVPARDEATTIRTGAGSLLRQDYPDLQVLLVDDRSTDGTGRIMAELAAAHPGRAQVLTVRELPPGWLGKNHALWLGGERAVGDWLLFTDADVVFAPGTLRRAIAYAESQGLDHLALFTGLVLPDYWLRAFIAYYQYAFLASQQPYLASDPRSRVGVGMGAFNLIRRQAYRRAGTFAAVSLRPDEDVRFGARVKRAGLCQGVGSGLGLIEQEWYSSLGAALRGLEKGLFAGLDYNPARVVGALGALLFLTASPYLLVWPARGGARWGLLAAAAVHSANVVIANRQLGLAAGATVPALPVAALLFCYAVVRSCARALASGGVRWRGTFYPLAPLRHQTGLEDLP